jgi:hypothetical protein
MSDPFPLINIAALSQVDELEGCPANHHHHHHHHRHVGTAVFTPKAASLTSPSAAAAGLHHHQHFHHRRSSSSVTVSTTTTTAKTGRALAMINRGWNRLGGGGPRVSHTNARYDGASHHYSQHDVSSEEAFQIKVGLMMKNPSIMGRFQERLRADSPYHGHDSIIRMEMQDFFEQELVLVDIGPDIRQATMPSTAVAGAAASTASSRSSLFRSALGALVNKADETTATTAPAAATEMDSSNNGACAQQLQSSSPSTESSWMNTSPFQNEGGPRAVSSNAQYTADDDDATTTTTPTSSEPNRNDENNDIERPAYLNLPSLEIRNDTTISLATGACSSPSLQNSLYEHEFSISTTAKEEETPDAVESIRASSSSSSSAGSSHDEDDSVGLSATTAATCANIHMTKQVAPTATESQSCGVLFEL